MLQLTSYGPANGTRIVPTNDLIRLQDTLKANTDNYITYRERTNLKFGTGSPEYQMVKFLQSHVIGDEGTYQDATDKMTNRLDAYCRILGISNGASKQFLSNQTLGKTLMVYKDLVSETAVDILHHDDYSLDAEYYGDRFNTGTNLILAIDLVKLCQLLWMEVDMLGSDFNIHQFINKHLIEPTLLKMVDIALLNCLLDDLPSCSISTSAPYLKEQVGGRYATLFKHRKQMFKHMGSNAGTILEAYPNMSMTGIPTTKIADRYIDTLLWLNVFGAVVNLNRLQLIAGITGTKINTTSTEKRLRIYLARGAKDGYFGKATEDVISAFGETIYK